MTKPHSSMAREIDNLSRQVLPMKFVPLPQTRDPFLAPASTITWLPGCGFYVPSPTCS